MDEPTPTRLLLSFALLLSSAAAQGVLPLSGTYRLAGLGAYFNGTCPASATPGILGKEGTITFGQDGSQSAADNDHEVCAGGTVISGAPGTNAGYYQVLTNGLLLVDDDPTAPGTDINLAFLRADGSIAILSRDDAEGQTAEQFLLVALSSGRSTASLRGGYHVARMLQRSTAAGLSMQSDLGVMQLDGAGAYTEAGTRHGLVLGGTAGAPAPYVSAGGYSIAADGTLTESNGGLGAVSADGELFFWQRRQGTEVEIAVGVRKGPGYVAQMLAGSWGIAALDNAIGQSGTVLQTDFGTLAFDPAAGSVQGSFYHVDTTLAGGTQASSIPINGAFTLAGDGVLGLLGLPGALSADGSLLLATHRGAEEVGLLLGVAQAAWPAALGAGTAGAGSLTPLLLPVGGFPHTGNAAFGLVLALGVGGAPAALALAAQAAPGGIPLLGGTVWIDPTQLLVSYPLVLSGPSGVAGAGAAGLALPLPANSLLGGVGVAVQAFVLDAAAPAGVAMSGGLGVVLCRG